MYKNGLHLAIFFALIQSTKCTAAGKVYVLNENVNVNENVRTGSVSVSIQLFNNTGLLSAGYTADVTVFCELTPNTVGYSSARFTPRVISKPQGQEPILTSVQYSVEDAGRRADLRCWGTSATVGGNPPQFAKQTSLSPAIPFTARKRGTVNICSKLVLVSNQARTNVSTFIIELSEPVVGHDVTVTCTSVPAEPGSDALLLVFPTTVMNPGNVKKEIRYQRSTSGGQQPVYVTCRGQSVNQGDQGQFSYNTSAGEPTLFVFDVGLVRIEPTLSHLYNTKMELVLHLDAPVAVSEVLFTCEAVKVNTTQQALQVANNPNCEFVPVTNPQAVTEAPAPGSHQSSSQPWYLATENVIIPVGSLHQTLYLERAAQVSSETQDLVVVTCCAPVSENQDPKYRNESAAVLIRAQLQPPLSINWTAAAGAEEVVEESTIQNPAYVELGPCPCDLTDESCDINCYCDDACSEDDRSTFTCISGVAGGQVEAQPSHICLEEDFDSTDWYPFLCVHTNRSAYLGRFYYPVAKIDSSADLLPVIDENLPPYDYRETEKRVPSEGVTAPGYKQGLSVGTGLNDDTVGVENFYTGSSYRLNMPRRGFHGACLTNAPLRYLHGVDSDCVHQTVEELCSPDSIWSAANYVKNSRQTHPPCPSFPQVLSEHSSKNITTTNVNYLCASDLGEYLHSLERREDIFYDTQQYKFAYEIAEGQEDLCHFDDISGAFMCPIVPVVNHTVVNHQRCPWDDGYSEPPVPTYDSITGTCHNVVLDVYYNFTWQDIKILELNATLIIGDVPLQTAVNESVNIKYDKVTIVNHTKVTVSAEKTLQRINIYTNNLTQKFKAEFFPRYIAPNESDFNITDNITDFFTTERYTRSGNPGYAFGYPVLSGIAVINGSEGTFQYMDVNDTYKLRLWNPGTDGLCENADSKPVLFGNDQVTSCMLRLRFADIMDCDRLRKLVLNQQDSLMISEYVSLVGDPNRHILSAEQWFQILRQNLTQRLDNSNDTSIELATTEGPVTTASLTTKSVTAEDSTTNTTEPTEAIYADQLRGFCSNIPQGIHVDILYTEAGQTNYKPIYNIVGVNVSYSLGTWRMRCIAEDGSSCQMISGTNLTTDNVQTFVVYSSVRFIQVPNEKSAPLTRYQLKQEDSGICKQESCWADILYPFQPNFPGNTHAYSVAFGCVALLHIIGLVCFTASGLISYL